MLFDDMNMDHECDIYTAVDGIENMPCCNDVDVINIDDVA